MTSYKTLLILIFSSVIFSCERVTNPPLPPGVPEGAKKERRGLWSYSSPEGEQRIYYKDGTLLSLGQSSKIGLRQGEWKTYTLEGHRVASIGKYLNDWRDGIWKYYDTEGKLYLIVTYAKEPRRDFLITRDYGNENGIYERYFPEGSIEEIGFFKGGFFEGPITRYHRNKKVSIKGQYKQDLMDGKWQYFYPEGNLEREENYKIGKKHGIFRNYHPDGTLYHETTFQEDIEIGTKQIYRKK